MDKLGDIIFKPSKCEIYESTNIFEKLDPYIKIFFRDTDIDQTEVQKAGGQNIMFEESLSLPIYKNDEFLFVELWDKDIATRDDLIGQHCINTTYLSSEGIIHDTIILFDKKNKNKKAQLQFTLEYYPDVFDEQKDLAMQEDFFEINQTRKRTEKNPLMVNIRNEHGQNYHVVNTQDVGMTEVVRSNINIEQEFCLDTYNNLKQIQYQKQNTMKKIALDRYENVEISNQKKIQSFKYDKRNPLGFSVPSQETLRKDSYTQLYIQNNNQSHMVNRSLQEELSRLNYNQYAYFNNEKLNLFLRIKSKNLKEDNTEKAIYKSC